MNLPAISTSSTAFRTAYETCMRKPVLQVPFSACFERNWMANRGLQNGHLRALTGASANICHLGGTAKKSNRLRSKTQETSLLPSKQPHSKKPKMLSNKSL